MEIVEFTNNAILIKHHVVMKAFYQQLLKDGHVCVYIKQETFPFCFYYCEKSVCTQRVQAHYPIRGTGSHSENARIKKFLKRKEILKERKKTCSQIVNSPLTVEEEKEKEKKLEEEKKSP